MQLQKYLEKRNMSHVEFAWRLGGVSESAVRMWCKGERVPRSETILRIQRLTQGAVTLADWHRHEEKAHEA